MSANGRLRALLVSTDLPPSRGGIQTMAREILARARRLEFAVAGGTRAAGLAAFTRTLLRRPDVVLALHPLAAPGSMLLRVPTVVYTHGGELRSARIARAARWAFPRAARVLCNSAFTRDEALRHGARDDRTEVLPPGAPQAVAAQPADLGGGRIVLSVARLEPHKGLDRLIAALRDLAADVRLVLVGEGSARDALQADARAADVAARVVFAGAVSDEDLPRYYAAADCFALAQRETPDAFEGAGIAILEAMAYGVPVVAGASGGVAETVRDGSNGLLVPPDGDVAAALRRVLDDGALAERLRAGARATARERSWEGFSKRLEDVMEEVARA